MIDPPPDGRASHETASLDIRGRAGFCFLGLAGSAIGRQQSDNRVEPSDLERREDLIGREVVVDDRVKFYVTRKGSEDDQLELKRTSVPFRVPRRLRPPAHSRMSGRGRPWHPETRRGPAGLRGDEPPDRPRRPGTAGARAGRPGTAGLRDAQGLGALGRAPRH